MKAAGLLAILLTACAARPPGPAEIAAREYRRANDRIESIELYQQRQRRCAARGGFMQVPRMTNGRLPPTDRELRLAICIDRFGGGQWL